MGWRGSRTSERYAAVTNAVSAIIGGSTQRSIRGPRRGLAVDRRLALGGGLAALGAAGFAGWFILEGQPNAASESLAVLPFANLSGDPSQAYFSDGLAEELRTALSRMPGLKVIGRVSSEKFRAADDVAAVARQLRVRNVLTGACGDPIRPPDRYSTHRWLEWRGALVREFRRSPGDVLAMQSDIAQKVGCADLRLGHRSLATLLVGTTSNPQARDIYFRAVAVRESSHSEDNFREAVGCSMRRSSSTRILLRHMRRRQEILLTDQIICSNACGFRSGICRSSHNRATRHCPGSQSRARSWSAIRRALGSVGFPSRARRVRPSLGSIARRCGRVDGLQSSRRTDRPKEGRNRRSRQSSRHRPAESQGSRIARQRLLCRTPV